MDERERERSPKLNTDDVLSLKVLLELQREKKKSMYPGHVTLLGLYINTSCSLRRPFRYICTRIFNHVIERLQKRRKRYFCTRINGSSMYAQR